MATTEDSTEWFEGKEFSTDWITRKLPNWERQLKRFQGRPIKILELGSYEGRSAIAFLNILPQAHITCIDLFTGSLEQTFDENVREYLPRLEKRKGSVIAALDNLAQEKRKFQVIYVDAGKKRDHVYVMSLLAWPLLRPHGLIIWDDYQWGKDKASEDRPKDAIDKFISEKSEELQVISIGSQVFVRKNAA